MMGWRWRPSCLLMCLAIHFASVQSHEDNSISFNDLLIIEDDLPISIVDKSNVQKRDAGCIFEPEIIPEGSEQFGIRLKPLKTQSTSFLEPAASTYRAAQYQPVRYNLPPLTSNENNNVNNVDYPPYNPPPKTTRNPYSISNYKATTPKYPLTSPETDDEAEPAGSGDVYDAVKPSTAAPEYLPPYKNAKTPVPRPNPVRFSNFPTKPPLVQQPTQNVNYIKPAPKEPLMQTNYLPPDTASSNVDTVRQPFKNSVYYTPTVPTQKPVAPQPTANYYFQTLQTTLKPIRVENLKNYLPPETAAPSDDNPSYVRPSSTTTTTPKPTIKSYEYLPPENPESTNDNPAFLKPAQPKKPVDGLGNRFTTPDEHYHTLEELCNDPFHSFLCVPLKPRSKDRFKNRNSKKVDAGNVPDSSFIQPRVVAPSTTTRPSNLDQPLVPASSFQDITRTKLPEGKPVHDCDKNQPIVPAPSINQVSVAQLPEVTYLPPFSSTPPPIPQTTASPKKTATGLYAKNPFSELIFENPTKPAPKLLSPQPFVAATYLQPQISYAPVRTFLPQPSNNQFQFVPQQFSTTIKPLILKDVNCNKQDRKFAESQAASSVSENLAGYNYPQPSPGYNYPQPAPSSIVTTGYSYPKPASTPVTTTEVNNPQPSASSIVATGYNYPQPSPSSNYPQSAASSVVSTGYSYPQPSPSSVVTTGYNYPTPAASSAVTTGYNYPQPSPSSIDSKGYNYPQPNPIFNEVPEASNEQPVATTGYQYPIPASNQQRLQPAASINYLSPAVAQPIRTTTTTTTTPAPSSTTITNLSYQFGVESNRASFESPKDLEVFPPLNPSQFTFGELDEINKFQAYTSSRPKPNPVPEKQIPNQFFGYNQPVPARNDTPLLPAADTSNGYYYPVPQPVVPAASANVESFEGYVYPRPSDNQPVFETTPKTESGYDYPVPPMDKRLSLPSEFFSQKVKFPLDSKKPLVRFEKEDCDRRFHSAGSQVTSSQEGAPRYQSSLSPVRDSNVYVLKV